MAWSIRSPRSFSSPIKGVSKKQEGVWWMAVKRGQQQAGNWRLIFFFPFHFDFSQLFGLLLAWDYGDSKGTSKCHLRQPNTQTPTLGGGLRILWQSFLQCSHTSQSPGELV